MSNYHPWRLSVAPMLDWTDRHCRFFHRLLSQHARLYTEMIHVGAILHGGAERFLRYDEAEHPLALQLGGSEPRDLAACAKLAEQWGYDEVNINCGCPSERVQRGSFGACLMAEPALVADGVKAMLDACNIAVTVKHRIGLDKNEDYAPVRDFVGTLADAGCQTFIVHARNAWLKGLSPKENRDVPPLRYKVVHQLKKDFPTLSFATNGGLQTNAQIAEQLEHVDGVMVGRQAYHHPWDLTTWDETFFGAAPYTRSRDEVELDMVAYMEREAARGVPVLSMARHMLGLRNGISGARAWRQVWSDHKRKALPPREIHQQAMEAAALYRVGD